MHQKIFSNTAEAFHLLLHKLLIHDHINPNTPRAAASDGDRYFQYLRPLPTELDGQKKEIYN